ncbi:MAG: PKD domain-containing protein, partial [Bacteroidota bacterium]
MHASKIALLKFLVAVWLGIGGAIAQPTANFTANNTSACEGSPLVVSFQSTSTGASSVEFFFGDVNNSSSTLTNPTFIYSDPGCYDVTLVATDVNGLTDTLTQTCFIEIVPLPVPDFSVSVTEGCAPLEVTFTDLSIPNAASITDYTWVVSDGSNSTLPSPTFTFLTPDTLDLSLTITNSNGCTNALPFSDVVIVYEAPILNFSVDNTEACDPPLTVNFTNTSQSNGAENVQYQWSFPGGDLPGGGNTFTGPTPPPVTYNNPGNYDASLILTSSNLCNDTLVITDLIGIGGVNVDFTADNQNICLGDSINFTSNTTGGVSSLGWNFGENLGIDSSDPNPTYTYTQPGTYTVTLFGNNTECGDTLVRTNFITVRPVPTADFSVDHDEDCQPGIPFIFTDASTNAVSWAWDFGDANTSTQQNPTHTYTDFGDFEVCLVVTNAEGCTDTFCSSISIQPPNIDFTISEREACDSLVINFSGTAVVPLSDPVISWDWVFSNGVPGTASGQNQTATF